MRRTKGFTLVELLVVVAIIALLVSILLPTLGRAKELAKRAMCGANLNGINKGLALYAVEQNDSPPFLPGITQSSATYDAELKRHDTCDAANLGEGAQQNLCLLVKTGSVPWKMFICHSSGNKEADRGGTNEKYGFGYKEAGEDGKKHFYIDYGLQVPYAVTANKCPWKANMAGGVVIMGDKAPVAGKLKTEFSPNHNDEGENLLYAAGNVKWSEEKKAGTTDTDKNTGGWGGNNVYTVDVWGDADTTDPTFTSNGTATGNPASNKDTVLYSWE